VLDEASTNLSKHPTLNKKTEGKERKKKNPCDYPVLLTLIIL